MFKLFAILLIVAAIVGLFFSLVRRVTAKSTPVALAVAIVLAALIAPVYAAYALMGAVVVAMFYVALV